MFGKQGNPYDDYDYDDGPRRGGANPLLYGCSTIALVTLVLGYLFIAQIPEIPDISWPSFGPTPAPTNTPVPTYIVIREIKEVSELVTVRMTQDIFIYREQNNRSCFLVPIRPTKIRFMGSGEVLAGVDLQLLTEENVQIDGDKAIVTLPPPIILNHGFNENRSILDIDAPYSACGDTGARAGELNSVRREASQDLLQAACEANILRQANISAERQIEGQLKQIFDFVEVIVRTQNPVSCP